MIIQDVRVNYGRVSFAFQNNTFDLEKVTFITGKNGTGKTTLLKAIAGLIPYTGRISETGTYVAQHPVVFSKSVYENIIYPLRIRKLNLKQYEQRINHLIDLFEVRPLLKQNAHTLSGGEKMKVTLLRALVFEPKIVLLDEPTTHLDLDSIDKLVKLIQEEKQNTSFLIVTHNKAFMDELMEEEYHLE